MCDPKRCKAKLMYEVKKALMTMRGKSAKEGRSGGKAVEEARPVEASAAG